MEWLAWRVASLLEHHDLVTLEHSRRVATYCTVAGYPQLWHMALCHDLGKYFVDPEVLNAPRRLTDVERNGQIHPRHIGLREHPGEGHRFLRELAGHRIETIPAAMFQVGLCHHERWDGEGYPLGLKADAIPRAARLIAVLDAYDAMTYLRAHCDAALTPEAALREIVAGAGTQFDPQLVRAVVPTLRRFGALPQYERLDVLSA